MINLLFVCAAVIYGMYAYLPFLNLTGKTHYLAGIALSGLASVVWVSISRNVPKDKIILFGAYFDIILTLCFIMVPLFVHENTLTSKQWFGISIMILGMILTKI